ncbi:MAG: hypothetical protein ACXW2I_20325 [Burkholderiales bacterium]
MSAAARTLAQFAVDLKYEAIPNAAIQLASLIGVIAHAYELDCPCHPSVGVHPGASLTAPGIPVAQASPA